jgi:DNA-binding NtrC family response regulator
VLVVDDDDGVRASVVRLLGARGFDVTEANDGLVAMGKLGTRAFDVVLTDVHMPHVSGNELLQHVRQERYGCQVVVMTAFADIASAVAAVRAGAFGFLTKPFVSNDALVFEVLNAARLKRLRERNDRLHRELGAAGVGAIIGASPPMQNLFRFIAGFAPSEASVLILGETGTGKELVAKALHDASARAAKPLVIVNCASIPEELIESELFGHVRGAFTSAHQARAGLFEAADGGRPSCSARSKAARFVASAATPCTRSMFVWWRPPTPTFAR